MDFHVAPSEKLAGTVEVPGDKSISHRAVILASIAEGTSVARNFLNGEDCLATMKAFQAMGVTIEQLSKHEISIQGKGKFGLQNPAKPLNLGNSGTSMRLLCGVLSGANIQATLSGDSSLNTRPMQRVTKPLKQMGAEIQSEAGGTAPLQLRTKQQLQGIDYSMPLASAQVKSCLLLAGLYAEGKTSVIEPAITRDHTERMLQSFAYPLTIKNNRIEIENQPKLTACEITIPGDISSASFFIVAAIIAKQANVELKNVNINPTRIGIINILREMGAKIELKNLRKYGEEPVADLVMQSQALRGIEIPQEQISLAIDEFPVLFIAACAAEGKTILRGAKELRVKESDRIQSMAVGLEKLGINVTTLDDGIIIEPDELKGGEVDSYGDHRIAMAFSVASLIAKDPITIKNCDNVATSFPNFVELANSIGLRIN